MKMAYTLEDTAPDTFISGNRIYKIQLSDTGAPQLSEGESRMSSLSRRACYKCGNVGHYAEVCSSSERLCYNCELTLDASTMEQAR